MESTLLKIFLFALTTFSLLTSFISQSIREISFENNFESELMSFFENNSKYFSHKF